jgi:integrase
MSTVTKTRWPGIYKRESMRGVRYDVKFRDPSGRQISKTCDTLDEARTFKREKERSIERDEYVDATDRITVAEYAHLYLVSRERHQRASTHARQTSMVRTHIDETELGRMPLRAVRREHVDQWLANRDVAHSTLRVLASVLRAVFLYAVENRRLTTAPAVRVGKDRNLAKDLFVPTVEEVHALADAMDDPQRRALVLVQAGTGLRVSEVLGLRVGDVSTTFRTVSVVGQVSRDGRRVPTKTATSVRTVPLSEAVVAVLKDHLESYPKRGPDALLFPSKDGSPIRQNTYHVQFKAAVKRAGLPSGLASHALRHYFATTLLRAGLSPVAVGRMLGHSDGSLVVKTYAHYLPEDDSLARAALDAAWSRTETGRRSGATLTAL